MSDLPRVFLAQQFVQGFVTFGAAAASGALPRSRGVCRRDSYSLGAEPDEVVEADWDVAFILRLCR